VPAIGASKVLSSMVLDGTLIAADIADNAVKQDFRCELPMKIR
jgi:hypothetical protein